MTAPTRFAEDHYASGQPTPAQLAELAHQGVRTVINLRTPDEPMEYDEAAEATRLGLQYVALPIAGAADLDRDFGNWAVANHDMASALRFKGYDYRFEFGRGAHDLRHGAAIFPQTLRWIWR